MEYIAVVIVSVGVSIITAHVAANIRCRKQLEILDKLFRNATEDIVDASRKVTASMQKALEEQRKNNQ